MAKRQTKKRHWTYYLEKMWACNESLKWAKRYKSPETAWKAVIKSGEYGWVEFIINRMISDRRFCCANCLQADLGLSLEELCERLPVPNINDLKEAAARRRPWELV